LGIVGDLAYFHTVDVFGASTSGANFDKGIRVANVARNWKMLRKPADRAGFDVDNSQSASHSSSHPIERSRSRHYPSI
jgi:hypothetical protein